MTAQQIAILAEIYACNARIAGMNAHNAAVTASGGNNYYAEDSFLSEADTLAHYAEAARLS